MPVFSSNVFGWARREISTSGGKTFGIKRFIAGPITIAISPIAQHALLQTEMNSNGKKWSEDLLGLTNQGWDSTPTPESTGRHGAGQAWNMLLSNHRAMQMPIDGPLVQIVITIILVILITSGRPSRMHCAISMSKLEFWTKGSIILPNPSAEYVN